MTTRTTNWFALVAVAGHLATEAGLTGWPSNSAIPGAADSFGAWLDARTPDDLATTASAVTRVCSYLAANANQFVTVAKSGETAISSMGWKDDNFYYIPSTVWKLIRNGLGTRVAAREFEHAGLLIGGDDGNRRRKTPVSIPGRPRAYTVKKLIIPDSAAGLEAA